MKNKLFILLVAFLIGLAIFTPSVKASEEWEEVTDDKSPLGYYTNGSTRIYYGFGNDLKLLDESVSKTQGYISRPTVFLKDLKSNRIVHHIYANGDGTSSSNLLFAFPSDEAGSVDGYKKYSLLGSPSKIYTKGSAQEENLEIKADSGEVNIPGFAKINVQTILSNITKESVKHEHVVTNLGTEPITFKFLKSVDTELNGNDSVPVYNIGDNKGLYIDAGDYRLDYIFNLENGPTSYRNWFTGGYRHPKNDGFEDQIAIPFVKEGDATNKFTILGVGEEVKNSAPDSIAQGRDDTGIWMKWEDVTLQPNESKSFTYYIGMYSIISGGQSVLNTTKVIDAETTENNFMKNELEYTILTNIIPGKKNSISKINLEVTLSDSENKDIFLKDGISVVDEQGQIIKEYVKDDVYDKDNSRLLIELDGTLLPDNEKVYLKFKVDVNKTEDDYTNTPSVLTVNANHIATLKNNESISYETKSVVKINEKILDPIPVYFIDENGRGIKEISLLEKEYLADFEITAPEIEGYEYVSTSGISKEKTVTSKFLEVYKESGKILERKIMFHYKKKPALVVENKDIKKLPESGVINTNKISYSLLGLALIAMYFAVKNK